MQRPARSILARNRHDAEALAARFPPLLAEARMLATTLAHGEHGRRKSGMGETFWQFRRARHEDPQSAIDWRRSARSDHLFVRETEWEAAQSVWMWSDGGEGFSWSSSPDYPSKRDRASVLLCAMAITLINGGERVGIAGQMQRPVQGRGGLEQACRALILQTSKADCLRTLALSGQPKAIIISDFYEGVDVWKARLAPFKAAGITGVLVQIHDPAEEDFPYQGRTAFTAPGAAEPLLFGRAQSIASAYQARFSSHAQHLAQLADALGWTSMRHRTDRGAAPALLSIYQSIAGSVR
jgi:uncharacterized protein (DUF58 family)